MVYINLAFSNFSLGVRADHSYSNIDVFSDVNLHKINIMQRTTLCKFASLHPLTIISRLISLQLRYTRLDQAWGKLQRYLLNAN